MAEDFSILDSLCNGYGNSKEDEKNAQEFIQFLQDNGITTAFQNLLDNYSKFPKPDVSQETKLVKFSASSKDNKITRLFGNFIIEDSQIDKDSFCIMEIWIPEWMIGNIIDKSKVGQYAENAKEWAAYWNTENLFMFQHPQNDWSTLRPTTKIQLVLIQGKNLEFLPEDDISVISNKFSIEGSNIIIDNKKSFKFVFCKKLIRRFFRINLEKSKYTILNSYFLAKTFSLVFLYKKEMAKEYSDDEWQKAWKYEDHHCCICKKKIDLYSADAETIRTEYTAHFYIRITKNGPICWCCFTYRAKPTECEKCDEHFCSRNQLFKHLKSNNHFT